MLRLALAALCCLAPAAVAPALGSTGAAATGAPRLGENFALAQPAMAMVWIPPGTFVMSSVHAAGDDTIVSLRRGYWLGRTEVTQAQWQAIVDGIPVFQNRPLPSYFKGSERPVERITWFMAEAYCARLNELERAAGRLPPGYEYALPTEAQWEYACRAGTTGVYAGDLNATAWYEANSGGETHPVAQKKPNAWGLYDLQGNVAEWCADWYAPYLGGRVEDPEGPATGVYRITRGGNAVGSAGYCRPAMRNYIVPIWEGHISGFRVALAPQRGLAASQGASTAERQ